MVHVSLVCVGRCSVNHMKFKGLMLHLILWYRRSTGFYICSIYKYTGEMSYLLNCLYFHIDGYLTIISLCFVNGDLFAYLSKQPQQNCNKKTLFNKNVTNQLYSFFFLLLFFLVRFFKASLTGFIFFHWCS